MPWPTQIAAANDMRELGEFAENLHESVRFAEQTISW